MAQNIGENRVLSCFFAFGMPFAPTRKVEESSGILVRWSPNGSSGW
jgi:hypothetical protein